ncbi:MAG: glycoside hydrolase family 43 protein [Acidimicrobiales bacterium]
MARSVAASGVLTGLALASLLAGCGGPSAARSRPGAAAASSASVTTNRPTPPPAPSPPPSTAPPRENLTAAPARIVTPGRNLPDPYVLAVTGGYDLFASQTGFTTPAVRVAFSRDLVHWSLSTAAMRSPPAWAVAGFTWAPDVHEIDGRYVLYFNAWARSSLYEDKAASGFASHAQCIGVATSKSAGGPYEGRPRPLVCRFSDHGAIDPRVFTSPSGKLFLDWKADDNAAAPGPFKPTTIYSEALAKNGLSFSGPPRVLLRADEPWQQGIVEAPQMVLVSGRYFLFYSGGWFNNDTYGIGVASCRGPVGPCTNRSIARAWLGSNGNGIGPGEESVFEDRAGRWWMVYSPWFDGYERDRSRPVALCLLGFGPRGPYPALP